MKPYVKEYVDETQIKLDITKLKTKGVARDDIYILTHDDERTGRLAEGVDANTIGMKEMDFSSAVGNMFNSQGDELRTKLKEIGVTTVEAENYEEDLDDGKILLIVTNHDFVEEMLV
ncbi:MULTISPECIES: general stress protein [Oceanobacillus]|uniref:General stress protein n=1 Tax=Oceanobacillus profundus TaxID=372463 RepID=A0A417YL22_9BACI|nr:general stress protein [Oceanobacillus profundus]MBR3120439.1 general stress protein [Oceanobacillus sp.]MCM3397065.1 general stress protein [Oceanobacillus profundus]MDO6449841.1 general stress protein [Oceanobacillus profundus]RHW33836.1 general stress protein [Oceanobacillus profundus]